MHSVCLEEDYSDQGRIPRRYLAFPGISWDFHSSSNSFDKTFPIDDFIRSCVSSLFSLSVKEYHLIDDGTNWFCEFQVKEGWSMMMMTVRREKTLGTKISRKLSFTGGCDWGINYIGWGQQN